MGLGQDKQYDLSWEEIDKVRRRVEIKKRLKAEVFEKKWNPFRQLAMERFDDPANDRYMDLKKRGRMPGTPLAPKKFYTLLSSVIVPLVSLAFLIRWERKDYLEGCASGKIGPEKRTDRGTP